MAKKKSSLQWQAFTSTLSTMLVLIMLGVTILTTLTADRVRSKLLHELPVTIHVADSVTGERVKSMVAELKAKPYVENAVYISKEDILREENDKNHFNSEKFTGENAYMSEIKVSVTESCAQVDSLLEIQDDVKQIEGVQDVEYPDDLVESLNHNLNVISVVFLVIASLLLIICVALINSTVRLSVYSRRFIIHTMKLVGASWSFIRRPFMLRSMWIGLIAGILADGVLAGIVQLLYNYDKEIPEYITLENLGIMAGSVVLCGLAITLVCTFISVSHFLRLKEEEMYK